MPGDLRLTPTSYIVLGLLEHGEATPYHLKARVAVSVGNFWSVPHSAIYAETERLAADGYLSVEQEPDGLRRKLYAITDAGRAVLEEWRGSPAPTLPEIRDESLLRLFFGADPRAVAALQVEAHREKLAAYENQARFTGDNPPAGPWLTLQAGIAHEREWVRYWSELAEASPRDRKTEPGAERGGP